MNDQIKNKKLTMGLNYRYCDTYVWADFNHFLQRLFSKSVQSPKSSCDLVDLALCEMQIASFDTTIQLLPPLVQLPQIDHNHQAQNTNDSSHQQNPPPDWQQVATSQWRWRIVWTLLIWRWRRSWTWGATLKWNEVVKVEEKGNQNFHDQLIPPIPPSQMGKWFST